MTGFGVVKTGISQRNENHDQINHEIECCVDAARKEAEMSRGRNGIMEKSNPGWILDGPAELERAQQKAKRTILEAEKFRATVDQPGNVNDQVIQVLENFNGQQDNSIFLNGGGPNVNQAADLATAGLNLLNIGAGVSDDDFFNLTCHIEPSLIHKIKKGEYVELEKLMPKEKYHKGEENRLEWVQRDGGTYLVPAQRDHKIGSFRRWEQAFRAYATIYCGANPHRSKEIWQNITVINTKATSYLWDNVYNYNIMFRHLMAFNPQRS